MQTKQNSKPNYKDFEIPITQILTQNSDKISSKQAVIFFETMELNQSSFFSGFSSLLFPATPKYESESESFLISQQNWLTFLVINAGVFTVF